MTPEAIANLIRQMTLEEKISLLHGELGDAYGANQAGHVPGVPRLGIPEVFIADGEYGVDITWDATAFPAKVSLAATFSEAVALDYGRALGLEARDAGMHMILSTRVNIARDPVAQIGQSNGGNSKPWGRIPCLTPGWAWPRRAASRRTGTPSPMSNTCLAPAPAPRRGP